MRIKDDCKLTDARMDAYLDGTLDEASRAAFLGHVKGCDRCGRELAYEEGLRKSCLALGAEGQEPPEGLHEGIMDAVRVGRSGRSRLFGALGSFSKAAAIVVISVAVGFGASVMIQRRRDAGDSATGNTDVPAGATAANPARRTVPSAAFVAAGEPETAAGKPDGEVEDLGGGDMGAAADMPAARAKSASSFGRDAVNGAAQQADMAAAAPREDPDGSAPSDDTSVSILRDADGTAARDMGAGVSRAGGAANAAASAAMVGGCYAASDSDVSVDDAREAAVTADTASDTVATAGEALAAAAESEPALTFTDAEANAPENAKLVRELADAYGAKFSEQAADGRRSVWHVELAADGLAPFVEALSAALAPRTAKINAPPAESAVVLVIIQDYK